MYTNSVLVKQTVNETTTPMGYKQRTFSDTHLSFNADVQPCSEKSLRKLKEVYGIASDDKVYKCFTAFAEISVGEYLSYNGKVLQVLSLDRWQRHTEFLLGVIKNGED